MLLPENADADAAAAADRAGVTIEEVEDAAELQAIESLFQRVWSTELDRAPINAEVLRALSHSGSYVALARSGDGTVAGAAVGFLARERRSGAGVDSLHSHIAAVAPGSEGRGIGRALKLHQRAFARRHGLDAVLWTFDPLVRRNAAFNWSLGVDFVDYLVDFYGAMADARNAGHGSDRLLARWDVTRPIGIWTAVEPGPGEASLLAVGAGSRPVRAEVAGDRTWVALPGDIEALRRSDPDLARQWRVAVRETLGAILGDWVVDGFTPEGRYALRRATGAAPSERWPGIG